MQWSTELALLLFFTGVGFFFAMAETALLTLGKWRLRQITTQYPARGAFIRKLLSASQDLLATITLGNTMAHGAIIASALVISLKFYQQHFLLVALTLVAGIFVFCEVVPKTLAMRHPEAWAPRVAFLMLWMVRITRPIRSSSAKKRQDGNLSTSSSQWQAGGWGHGAHKRMRFFRR